MSEPEPSRSQSAEPELPPTRIIVVRWLVTLLLLVPVVLVFPFPVKITDARGTEEFYAVAAQVLPALLIALALELRGLAAGLIYVFGREHLRREALNPLIVLALLLTLMAGEYRALSALLDCSRGVCADPDALSEVIYSLISGAVLVLVSFILAVLPVFEGDQASQP